MSRHMLRKIVSILRESPLYESLSPDEKRAVMRELTESYAFLKDGTVEDIVGYESSWAGIIDPRH